MKHVRTLAATLALAGALGGRAAALQDETPAPVQPPVPTLQQAQALQGQQKWAEAAAAFALITEAQPNNENAWFNLGYCLHMAGDLDRAHDVHLKAATFTGSAPLAFYNHACVHALRGEKTAAFAALAEARAAGFSDINQFRGDTDMAKLRDDPRFELAILEMSPRGTFNSTPLHNVAQLPATRRFDFWLGDWEFENEGETMSVSVERVFDGLGLRSTSRSLATGEAKSSATLVYRPETKKWREIFIGRQGEYVILEGGLEGKDMVLYARSADGESTAGTGRLVFTNITSRSFDTRWDASTDDGATWTPAVTMHFVRK